MKKIGSYAVLEKLGQTSTNTLYVGEHESTGKLAVLRMANTPEWNEQVTVKGGMLSSVKHSAVVEIYEQGTQRGDTGTVAYFAAEYAKGHPLQELMENHRQVTMKEKLELLVKMCEGIHVLNGAGHVCLCTPDDVMVRDGGVKIMDVHAKLPPNLQTSARVIQTKAKRIPFWTPELIKGENDRDRREDVFCMGLLTYLFVTGEDPFKSVIPIERAEKILAESAPAMTTVAKDCPAALEATVMKALKKDRKLRQQSVREFGAELRLVSAGL